MRPLGVNTLMAFFVAWETENWAETNSGPEKGDDFGGFLDATKVKVGNKSPNYYCYL
jgi:hypothetical protein